MNENINRTVCFYTYDSIPRDRAPNGKYEFEPGGPALGKPEYKKCINAMFQ